VSESLAPPFLAEPVIIEKSVAFITLGCKTNLLESSSLSERFVAMGYTLKAQDEPASLYVFNTCTVTERADAESRRLIRKLRRQNPDARIAVTGCYAQVNPDAFKPLGVDFVIGNNLKDHLPELVAEQYANYYADMNDGPLMLVDEFEKSRELVSPIGNYAGIARTRGSLKIQDGCDYKCTYCIIWKGRGPSRSLSVDALIAQVKRMVSEGFKDITITGINIGQYDHNGVDLSDLLKAMYTQIDGDYQLRLSSLDPLEVTDKLMNTIAASHGKIAPHIHLSSQSADDGVLKAMARRHHVKDLIYVCNRFKELMPSIAIGSDMIVGFPTESAEAFERSYAVIEHIPMHYLHVFRYSPRPGTPAAEMRPQVQDSIRKERATRLIALADRKKRAFFESHIGKVVSVLIEGHNAEEGYAEGITENYIRVRVMSNDLTSLPPNHRVSAKIETCTSSEYVTATPC